MNVVERIVRVLFKGDDQTSPAAARAEQSVSKFGSVASTVVKGLAALGITAALGGFFKKAIDEALEGEQSLQRLKTAVGGAGASYDALQPSIGATVSILQRLTTFTDDDLNGALSNMIVMTGDAAGSLDNLQLAADLAAAKNIDLETASAAIGKAMTGNTTALQKLIPELKTSGDVLGDLRTKVDGAAAAMGGTFAGSLTRAKNQFAELAQSVGDAILGSDAFTGTGDALVATLASMALWVEDNADEIGKLVDALATTAENIGDALIPVIRVLWAVAKPVFVGLVAIITEASFAVRAGVIAYQEYAGNVAQIIGGLVEKAGGVLKALGIDVVSGMGSTLKRWGETLDKNASASWTKLETDFKAFNKRMLTFGDDTVAAVGEQERTKTRHITTALEDQEKATKESIDRQKALWKLIDDNVAGYRRTLETLRPAIVEAMRTGEVAAFNTTVSATKAIADKAFEKIRVDLAAFKDELDKTKPPTQAVTDELERARLKALALRMEGVAITYGAIDIAGAFLDVAASLDVVDGQMQKMLDSVLGIAEGVARIYSGDVVGGAAGIVSSLGSLVAALKDSENRRILAGLAYETNKLREAIGDLTLNVSGEDFEKTRKLLNGLLGDTPDQAKTGAGLIELLSDPTAIYKRLSDAGLTVGDLERIGKEMGLQVVKNGGIDRNQLVELWVRLQATEFGTVAQDFTSQLEFFQKRQELEGSAGTAGGLAGLIDFLRNAGGVDVLQGLDLTDLSGTRARLLDLFTQLNNGGIDASQLGKLTGGQFADLLETLIGKIDELGSAGPGGVDTGAGTLPDGTITPPDGGGIGGGGAGPGNGIPVVTMSLADVVAAVTTQTDQTVTVLKSALEFQRRTADNTGLTVDVLTDIRQLLMQPEAARRSVELDFLESRRIAGTPAI